MKMDIRLILLVCTIHLITNTQSYHQKREIKPDICNESLKYKGNVQCFCIYDHHEPNTVQSADCYLVKNISSDDASWKALAAIKNVNKLSFSNNRGIPLEYVPVHDIKHYKALTKVGVEYGNIKKVDAYSFDNMDSVREIILRNNQITKLEANSFINLKNLKELSLENNKIIEINRNVFVNLPSIELLYLTNNKITTIHDRAFIHLNNLKDLEVDRNKIFSLNSESFIGLVNLEKLDLSNNSLEVIGDNTFQPLFNLLYLNLDNNRIQMIDEKAFKGLHKLTSLSLARNKLIHIDAINTFQGLNSLSSLNLKGNQIQELSFDVMLSVLSNFYAVASYLDIEENNFHCDCRLEWFTALMNKTQSNRLKTSLENLKCEPDQKLKDQWLKYLENEKTDTLVDDTEPAVPDEDYEFYDETQLDGKLFYTDVRILLDCPKSKFSLPISIPKEVVNTNDSKITPQTSIVNDKALTKIPFKTKEDKTTIHNPIEQTKTTNYGILDLSLGESTARTEINPPKQESEFRNKQKSKSVTDNSFTTIRLATVSAKPIDTRANEDNMMASDEAKPDNLKPQKSVDAEITNNSHFNHAHRRFGCVINLLLTMLSLRLLIQVYF